MPAPGCKFHWEEEPDKGWRALARFCSCGSSKMWVTTLVAVWPDGSKHPEPPAWVCYDCTERAAMAAERLIKELGIK